jgi:hypothetical protein
MIKRKGIIPNGGELLRTFGPGRTLALYKLKTTSKWLSLKLILAVGTAIKANYSMYWDGERVAGNDFLILGTHEKEIAQEIEHYLKENFAELPVAEATSVQRTSEGVHPEDRHHIGELKNIDGSDWRIYSTPKGSSNVGIKIASIERITGRANYGVEWNGNRFIRNADFSRLAERIELLAAAEDFMENYVEGAPTEPEKSWINLDPVGVVANLERDLLVHETTDGCKDVEVRLSTSDPGILTDSYFYARQEGSDIVFIGPLRDALKRTTPEVWARVEESMRQYFMEKDFY